MIWTNGDNYEGEWLKDQMHGNGIYNFPNGTRYEGKYFEGMKHGQGQII